MEYCDTCCGVGKLDPETGWPDRTESAQVCPACKGRTAAYSPEEIKEQKEKRSKMTWPKEINGTQVVPKSLADFWEDRYRTQHRTLHKMEDEIRDLREENAELKDSLES